MFRRVRPLVVVLLAGVLLAACALTPSQPDLLASPSLSATTASSAPSIAATPPMAAGAPSGTAASSTAAPTGTTSTGDWQTVAQAMETRSLRLAVGSSSVTASVIRFDPQAYRVRVRYDQFNAGFLDQWNTALQPLALINGGFFDENDRATGLVIFDGVARGETYQGFGGMVVINADGEFELRSLRQQPYDPDELLQQAMQSAPMLIQPGGEVSQLDADTDRSRRSVIAQDRQGRVILIAIDVPLLTLPELAQALAQSNLELDAALALDGGRSTGLFLNTEQQRIAINSFDQVPLILTVDRHAD
jgi:exopolysaccharide biosynthesis protein